MESDNGSGLKFNDRNPHEVGLYLNKSGFSDEEVEVFLKREQAENAALSEIGSWVNMWSGRETGPENRARNSTPFNQDRYTIPGNVFDQMKAATDATLLDDVVGNAIDITEQVAFNRIGIESNDNDSSDIGRQILDDVQITTRMREIWREEFAISQCYVATQWGRKDYRVKEPIKGSENGRKRKKVFKNLLVPTSISLLDPLKVIPVGNFLFGQEELAYIADKSEAKNIDNLLAESNTSDINPSHMFIRKYIPTEDEKKLISEFSGNGRSGDLIGGLYILDPDRVFRITATRPSYKRFADIRLLSIFELLDLKHNLRESDRSDILGNINSIVIVKRGSETAPTSALELHKTATQFRSNGRNSMIVTDHRMEVEILTKKIDKTLQPERYNTLDSRITARIFQLFQTGNYATGTATDNSGTLFKIAAASMNARREDIRIAISKNIVEKIWEHNDELKGDPVLTFYPRRIALEFDQHYSTLLKELMVLDSLSRETMLDELDIDFEMEMARIEDEGERFGRVSETTNNMRGLQGEVLGGNQNGGGSNTKSYEPSPNDGRGKTGAQENDVK